MKNNEKWLKKKRKWEEIFLDTEKCWMRGDIPSLRYRDRIDVKESKEGKEKINEWRGERQNHTSGRETDSIIALIDQPDNSISICVIQMVFNFPQRYLHSSIYILFVQNCPPSFPALSDPFFALAFFVLFFFFKSFKNCGLSCLHVINLSSKLFPSRMIKLSNVDIKCIYKWIIWC